MNTPTQGRLATLLALTLICGVCIGLLLPRNGDLRHDEPTVAAMAYDQEAEIILSSSAPTAAASLPSATPENLFMLEVQRTSATAAPAPSPTDTENPAAFTIEVLGSMDTAMPKKRVLIYHTHTWEAYRKLDEMDYQETQQWRTDDNHYNMVRVGEELAGLLRGLGFEVVHDATAFEPPDLSSAYTRSLKMLEARRAAGETYDLCIDLHRDAYGGSQAGDNSLSAGSTELARLMLLIGKGEGQTTEGFAERPDWQSNLKLAQAITEQVNAQVGGLCKDVMLKSGRFNQHMGVGCILVEAGNNQNTLPQVLASMPYLADAIAQALKTHNGE